MPTRPTRYALTISAMLFGAVIGGCHSGEHESAEHSEHASGAPHWSYEGQTGPAHWGTLSPDYALCATGKAQSPIDVESPASVDLPNIVFHYLPVPVEIINNGHTVQVNYPAGSFIEIDGVRYDLVQFHFHCPSEHEIAGHRAAAELHLVHKSDSGALAVVGVMIEEGAYNASFDPVWSNLPKEPGPAVKTGAVIDAASLLPTDPRTIRYDGSLTTPPGTEGVKWNLMVQPVTLSHEQLEALREIINGNVRPIQPLNRRKVVEDSTR